MLSQAALESEDVSEEQFDQLVAARKMVGSGVAGA
jgi:hypothetical protein